MFLTGGWGGVFFLFTMCSHEFSLHSHQIPNMFPIALYFVPILCLKFYFCNLYNQPELGGHIPNISILGIVQRLWQFYDCRILGYK